MGGETFYCILIIDHDMQMRKMIREILAEPGVIFVECASCEEALNAFRSVMFDLVILDHQLPDGNGEELISRARDHASHIVVLSAEMKDDEHRGRMLGQGASVALAKPFFPHELRESLNQLRVPIHFQLPTLVRRRSERLS